MPKEVKKESKEKKHFWKDFRAELKRVIWPTPKQLVNSTVAVVTVVLATAAIVFALDLGLEKINTYGINKLKSAVNSSKQQTNTNETNTTEENANSENTNTTENTQSGIDNTEQNNSAE